MTAEETEVLATRAMQIEKILDAAEMLATGLYDTGPYTPPSSGIGGVAAVPEPAVWPVAAAAIGAGIVASRRRRCPALRTSLSP